MREKKIGIKIFGNRLWSAKGKILAASTDCLSLVK